MRAGLLDDPNRGLNVLKARWVEEMIWFYRRTFTAPALAAGERAWLVFEGLDLAAVVYLNGEEVGRHANAFYPCRIDVTDALRAGENTLLVQLEAGLYPRRPALRRLRDEPLRPLHKRNWLRTTQSAFGWDWSPRLLNVGIPGDVRLEIAAPPGWRRWSPWRSSPPTCAAAGSRRASSSKGWRRSARPA